MIVAESFISSDSEFARATIPVKLARARERLSIPIVDPKSRLLVKAITIVYRFNSPQIIPRYAHVHICRGRAHNACASTLRVSNLHDMASTSSRNIYIKGK